MQISDVNWKAVKKKEIAPCTFNIRLIMLRHQPINPTYLVLNTMIKSSPRTVRYIRQQMQRI